MRGTVYVFISFKFTMKSRLWVLCGVALLCFGTVRCIGHFTDDEKNFLDTTRDGDEGRTEKEEDIEMKLYNARNTWNALTNEINELYRMRRIEKSPAGEVDTEASDVTVDKGGKGSGGGEGGGSNEGGGTGGEGDNKGDGGEDEDDNGGDGGDGNGGDGGDGNGGGDGEDENGKGGDDEDAKELCKDFICYNGGSCKPKDGEAECECDGEYTGTNCEIYPEEECKKKIENCAETSGQCITKSKTTVVCNCPPETNYRENVGCKKPCDDFICYNGGSCKPKEGKPECECVGGYTGDTCEKYPEEECKNKIKNCAETSGQCITKSESTVECNCPPETNYRENVGCKKPCEGFMCYNGGSCKPKDGKAVCECVGGYTGANCEMFPQEECEKKNPKCANTKGKCISLDETNIKCECPADTSYDANEGCKENNFCEEVCGNKPGVKCNGDKKTKDKITCSCEDDGNKSFDTSTKECKTDYCKTKCGTAKCKGNAFEEGAITCYCDDNYDFIEKEKKCKKNYCKTICGTEKGVKCEEPYKIKTTKDCSCEDNEEYVFKDKRCQKKCSDDDECVYDGSTCNKTSSLCDCVKGTFGDTCEKIKDCEKGGKYENCTGERGTCEFNENDKKAVCECSGDKLLNDKKGYCEEDNCTNVCGVSFEVKETDAVKCVANNAFGNVKCQCKEKNMAFDYTDKECKTDYCKEKCGTVTCKGNKFEEDKITCVCADNYDFNEEKKKCKLNYCKKTCGTEKGIKCEDPYKIKTVKDCSCEDSEEYVWKNKRCQKKCSDNDECLHGGTCNEKSKLCDCVPGTIGDTCEKIKDCEPDGIYENCKGNRGTCEFIEKTKKTNCTCPEGKELYKAFGYCEARCETSKDCSGSHRTCNKDKFCVCVDGYEGEDCEIVTGCKVLAEKCKEIERECIFSIIAPGRATCYCKYPLTYDRVNNKCLHSYCFPNNHCKNKAECTPDETTSGGYCKCPEDKFYNYKTEQCEGLPDKCLLKKTPCAENEVCKNGKCECKYKKNKDEECKATFCTSSACFEKAKCSEDDGGTCLCEEGKYYKNKKCQDTPSKCNLKDFKKTCICPTGMERKEKSEECVPKKDEDKLCSTDCGYGLCVKIKDKENCKCFSFANSTGGKCLLKKSFCAGEVLQEDSMKCKCEGQYIQADDGITCRLKTCKDDVAQKDCASRGGNCNMNWKGNGYFCECPSGYDMGDNGKCTDPCSIEKNIKICSEKDQFCYNSLSSKNDKTGTCSCPPTVQLGEDGKCSSEADYVSIMKNIPVLKKRYELKSGGINKVLLSSDLTQSLELSFGKDVYDYGYLYDYRVQGDVVICSIWVNFKRLSSLKEDKTVQFIPKTFSKICDDCDETVSVWPPNVLLAGEGLRKSELLDLTFCSNEVKDLFCGKGSVCKENKCTCDEGFKIIEYSIKEIGPYKAQRCEDINECATGDHICSANTTCVNTFGSYKCVCNEGFKKEKEPENPENDKSKCYDMCTPSPCRKGKCVLKDKTFDCQCEPGVGGSLCDREDANYASAKKGTVVVGAVLGTLLALGAIAILYYIIKVRKNSGSEDFVPAPRMDHAEMAERRGMRGVTNKAYE